jgi:NAD(P)-dependent dehydrogenase (short-subunit alcohol dehydrogenase family)
MPVGIVTGASRGLGLALSRALVERGWRLVVDARGEEALAAAVESLGGARGGSTRGADAASRSEPAGSATAIAGDVADPTHRQALVEAAGGRIDLLVNNASLLGPSPQPALADYPPEVLRRVYEVNVFAPLELARLALPRMQPGAAIVNVTSDAAVEPYEGWGGYGSSKAALEQISAILAVEHHELRVYTVDPGDMLTQMHQEAFPGEDISDRPPPEESVPGLLALIEGPLPSGRYRASEVGASR